MSIELIDGLDYLSLRYFGVGGEYRLDVFSEDRYVRDNCGGDLGRFKRLFLGRDISVMEFDSHVVFGVIGDRDFVFCLSKYQGEDMMGRLDRLEGVLMGRMDKLGSMLLGRSVGRIFVA